MEKGCLKIAYILMIHKNPEQVNIFLKQLLQDEQADIYIHTDKNSIHELEGKIIHDPRIYHLSNNVHVTWGDINQVDAMALLLKEVVDSGKYYDFLCYRSGQDIMVKNGYNQYLAFFKGKNFFSLKEINIKSEEAALFKIKFPKCTRELYDTMHPYRVFRIILRKLYGKGINLFPNNREFNKDIKLYTGDTWFNISLDLAKYILDFLEENKWFYNAFTDGLAPDRMFFNTLVMNSPFRDSIINEAHTFERWGTTYRTNNHPVILTYSDVQEIEASNCYFARKFDINIDKRVIEYFFSKTNGQILQRKESN